MATVARPSPGATRSTNSATFKSWKASWSPGRGGRDLNANQGADGQGEQDAAAPRHDPDGAAWSGELVLHGERVTRRLRGVVVCGNTVWPLGRVGVVDATGSSPHSSARARIVAGRGAFSPRAVGVRTRKLYQSIDGLRGRP